MKAADLCSASLYDEYFEQNPDDSLVLGPEAGVYQGAYCTGRVSETGDDATYDLMAETMLLAYACDDPSVRAVLGSCMLYAEMDHWGENPGNDRSNLRFCFPTVDQLQSQVEQLRERVPAFNPPRIKRFDGETYTPVQFLAALTNGDILVSECDGHDMINHGSIWLFIKRNGDLFQLMQRSAENALLHPGKPDAQGNVASNKLMDGFDCTVAIIPTGGRLLSNPTYTIDGRSPQMKFMRQIMGSTEGARHAFSNIGMYAQQIGGALLQDGV